MKLVKVVLFNKEKKKAMCKYIDLSEEYVKISFFGWGSPSEFNYGHSL